MRLMQSLKNTIKRNFRPGRALSHKKNFPNVLPLLLLVFLTTATLSCAPSYPAKTLTKQLTELVKEELKLNVTCHISGKTLWVWLPLENLIDEEEISWNEEGLDVVGKAIQIVHRVVLSTDAKLNFLAVVATDVKSYGVQVTTIEYIPDLKEAILEKFSRGEFFSRSLKDVENNPNAINDMTGKSNKFYDISFKQFLSLQIIHRTKMLFSKDETLKKLFEVKSASWKEKFGIFRIDFEFLKKTYNMSEEEKKIDPLYYVKMIVAAIVKNYDFKDFQVFQISDTFSQKTEKLSSEDIQKIKIKLPKLDIG